MSDTAANEKELKRKAAKAQRRPIKSKCEALNQTL